MTGGYERRPRVVWVTAEPPHFSLGGGNIRQAHLLEQLSYVADVHLISYGVVEDPRVRSSCVAVTDLPAQAPAALSVWRRRLTNLRRCLPGAAPHEIDEARIARRALTPVLAAALREAPADAVCVEHVGLAPLAPPPGARRERWAITMHYLPSGAMAQWADVASTAAQRVARRREAAHARRLEASLSSRFDTVIAVSEDDAAGLGSCVVVPNGVRVEDHVPTPVPASSDLVFVGRLDFLPNVDGICWFADAVLPHVRREHPDVRLVIVGRDPADDVRALASRPDVVLHADVADVRPFLRDARASIVPLRMGTGTRLKALEALAAGRPVVGTRIGLAGLDLSERHALIAEGEAEFAAAVIEVLRDDGTAQQRATAGRALVEQRFAWSRIAPVFIDAVLDRPAGPAQQARSRISAWAAADFAQS